MIAQQKRRSRDKDQRRQSRDKNGSVQAQILHSRDREETVIRHLHRQRIIKCRFSPFFDNISIQR